MVSSSPSNPSVGSSIWLKIISFPPFSKSKLWVLIYYPSSSSETPYLEGTLELCSIFVPLGRKCHEYRVGLKDLEDPAPTKGTRPKTSSTISILLYSSLASTNNAFLDIFLMNLDYSSSSGEAVAAIESPPRFSIRLFNLVTFSLS